MSQKTAAAIPKTGRRKLVPRNLLPAPGIANLIVIRSGDEIRRNLSGRLADMMTDLEKVEFFWDKLIRKQDFHETREYHEYGDLARKWELQEGVKDLMEYRNKMNRFRVLLGHFHDGFDYELTVQEAVEVLS